MTIELLIDQMERELGHAMPVDRMVVQSMLEQSLQLLASQEEFDFLKRSLEPLLQTEPGVREYALPVDFGTNFLKFVDPDTGEDSWACKIDDGSSAYALHYEAPEVFYRRDLSAESDASPTNYTVETGGDGIKYIVLAPPPNTTSFTVSGTYIPASFKMDKDSIPAAPAQAMKYDVMRSFGSRWDEKYNQAMANLYYTQAKVRDSGFSVAADNTIGEEF